MKNFLICVDGTTWTEVGRVTLELPERLLAGMAAAEGGKELDERFERLVAKVCKLVPDRNRPNSAAATRTPMAT